MSIKVDIHIAGYNDFHCPVGWKVEEARNEIRSMYLIQGGGIEKNGILMRSDEKIQADGSEYYFVNFQLAPSSMPPSVISQAGITKDDLQAAVISQAGITKDLQTKVNSLLKNFRTHASESIPSPAAYCEEIENKSEPDYGEHGIQVVDEVPGEPSILTEEELDKVVKTAENKNQLILVNFEEYKWMKQHKKSSAATDLKTDMFVTLAGLHDQRPEPQSNANNRGLRIFRRQHIDQATVNSFVFGTLPWRAKPYLRLVLEFTDKLLAQTDTRDKRGKMYQYLTLLVKDDAESRYSGVLCGKDGFLYTVWQGDLRPGLRNFVRWTLPGSRRIFMELIQENRLNFWPQLLKTALKGHDVRLQKHSSFLGAGRFGQVFSVIKESPTGHTTRKDQSRTRFALKIIRIDSSGDKNGDKNGATIPQVQSEYKMIKKLKDSEHVVNLEGDLHELRSADGTVIGYSYLMSTVGSPINLELLSSRMIERIFLTLYEFHQGGFYHGDCLIQNILISGDKILFCDLQPRCPGKNSRTVQVIDLKTLVCSILGTKQIPAAISGLIQEYELQERDDEEIIQNIVVALSNRINSTQERKKQKVLKGPKEVKLTNHQISVLAQQKKEIEEYFSKLDVKDAIVSDNDILERLNLRVVDRRRNGDCFFRVMAAQMRLPTSPYSWEDYSPEELRLIVDNALWTIHFENPELFLPQGVLHEVQEYLLVENHDGYWADDFMISTLAVALGINITITNRNNLDQSYTVRGSNETKPFEANLLYTINQHYQSLEPPLPVPVPTATPSVTPTTTPSAPSSGTKKRKHGKGKEKKRKRQKSLSPKDTTSTRKQTKKDDDDDEEEDDED